MSLSTQPEQQPDMSSNSNNTNQITGNEYTLDVPFTPSIRHPPYHTPTHNRDERIHNSINITTPIHNRTHRFPVLVLEDKFAECVVAHTTLHESSASPTSEPNFTTRRSHLSGKIESCSINRSTNSLTTTRFLGYLLQQSTLDPTMGSSQSSGIYNNYKLAFLLNKI